MFVVIFFQSSYVSFSFFFFFSSRRRHTRFDCDWSSDVCSSDLGQWTEPSRYLCYLALALLASGMKVNLPGVHGTMSVIFLFILIGVRELTLAQDRKSVV